jgi:hypothetical protein
LQQGHHPEEARSAIPEASAIRIDTPKDTADAPAAAPANALVAEGEPSFDPTSPVLTHSDYARWSYVTAWTVNGGAWWTLATLRIVTLFPPTACSGDTCTWVRGTRRAG